MTTATANAVAFPHLIPTTAIGWLKAIGLLRLSGSTGFWKNDCFYLEINSIEALVTDILHNYQPKPFISPWNSYSLLAKADGLDKVLASQSERYALMREGYQELQNALGSLNTEGQSAAQKKLTLMADLPRRVSNPYWLEWINAVGLMVNNQKGARFLCNDLLGTGGNVGTTDFCTAYFQACSQLWDLSTGEPGNETEAFIRASVAGEVSPGTLLLQGLLGHTYPAADYFDDLAPSGLSQADYLDNGGRSSQLANPIDLILYLEGAATFTGKAIPRNEVQNEGEQEYTLAAYPLLLEVNSGSADTSDRTGRAYEIWLPLWDEPMDWADLQNLVTTDLAFRLKCQVVDTTDMLDLITKRSEYQGLSRFSRFGLWTRKGQGKYLVHVGLATPGEKDFGAELRAWRLQARPSDKQSQAQYNLLTAIQKTLYRLQQGNSEATTTIRLLGQLEVLHSRIKANVPPCPQLGEKWVEAVYAEYQIAEVELAAALASTAPTHLDSGHSYPFRRLLSSARYVPSKGTWFWSDGHNHKLKTSSLEALCLSLLKLWNELWEKDRKYHPAFGWTYRASSDAIAAFIAGTTNDSLILDLALGFALCRTPRQLASYSAKQPLPKPYQYAASLQWGKDTNLTIQTVNGLLAGSTLPLSRQLAAIQKPKVLPSNIAVGKRCALALVFPVNLSID
ncbi:type I-G CRISPR-associated protein Cas8g1/Csx17 [Leptolyngbya sp. GGD]|uniref:type I-G CRISPR-associated protein Cas8g1/Csx17 n=1 Tax=Leptolyngbya sp. GGD TaxID=2997907 RepID=UPI00227A1AF2|nr:type I-U CRISPR-associated protein Csx17 [Leptolyngbya sp. GGD]MCY6494598.1 type I-U CRISPR-associated protein Csx17 [Leptolyngbya sp. GGD]